MFEVGKKYIYKHEWRVPRSGRVFICLAVYNGGKQGWIQNAESHDTPWTNSWGTGWIEYHESAVETFYGCASRGGSMTWRDEPIGFPNVAATWTDGHLTSIELIKKG